MSDSIAPHISLLGCGWLGQALAAYLQEQGVQVKGTVSSAEKQARLAREGIETLVWKLGDAVPPAFWGGKILIVTIPPGATKEDDAGEAYAKGLAAVLEAGKQKGIQKVIYTSSTSVYGDAEGEIKEHAPLLGGRRSADKVIAAELALRKVKGIGLTVLRLTGLVGGERQPGKWFAGKHKLQGGHDPVNLVHRNDVMRVIHEVIRQQAWGQTFNVCADQHPAKADYYPEMARKMGLEVPTFANPDETSTRWIDNQHLKAVLGFAFDHPNPFHFPFDKSI